VPVGEGIAGWVRATGTPLTIDDTAATSRPGGGRGVLSAVSVPIADEDGVLGVLNVGTATYSSRFAPCDLRALESLGRLTAAGLRNAWSQQQNRTLFIDSLQALVRVVEESDPFRANHTERVLDLCEQLATILEMPESAIESLRYACVFHDIGMGRIGPAVTARTGSLTTVERTLLRLHPEVGAEALAQVPALRDAVPVVLHHHEHFDGRGYVRGVSGEQIPLGARVLAVADAFVALTSQRPYREAIAPSEALDEIGSHAGTQFDPRVVLALYESMRPAS
ncbi:MAG: HD domain-containing protein, partial [Coriobacteriia bacterium]|nr:HD domain-containing protein [Coriobacteriia bacterium]